MALAQQARVERFDNVLDSDTADDLPADWQEEVRIALPGRSPKWACLVVSVSPTAQRARDFGGGAYLHSGNLVAPGSVVIGADNRTASVACYILLPGGLWYQTRQRSVKWTPGWGRIIRQHVTEWVALPRIQRIMRACDEAIMDLRIAQAQTPANSDEEQGLLQAIAHYESIAAVVIDEPVDLAPETISRSFEAWIQRVSTYARTDRDAVIAALNTALESAAPVVEDEVRPPQIVHVPECAKLLRGLKQLNTRLGISDAVNPAPGPLHNSLDAVQGAAGDVLIAVRRLRTQLNLGEEQRPTASTPPAEQTGMQRLARNIRIRRRRNADS